MYNIARAPDPALAAANLSRLLSYGVGEGRVLGSSQLLTDLLFVLGASQFLAIILLSQESDWERTFLISRQTEAKTVEAHLSSLHTRLEDQPADFCRY